MAPCRRGGASLQAARKARAGIVQGIRGRSRGPNPMAPRKTRQRDPARSRRVLRRPDVIPDGRRRKDRRDWLSVVEEGHPEQLPPRKEGAV